VAENPSEPAVQSNLWLPLEISGQRGRRIEAVRRLATWRAGQSGLIHATTSPGKQMKSVVTLMGYGPENLSTISLNNVVVDGPTEVKAEFAKLTYGPGPVSFTASGRQVTVDNKIANPAALPYPCAGKFIDLSKRIVD